MNSLAKHYTKFKVTERTLLTGHSHQAWPDCALKAQIEAFEDAAKYVDAKWTKAFEKADRVRAGFAKILNDDSGLYSLAPNTHDLIVRFLSSLDLKKNPRIVTTDSEFHSLRRQLKRLEEEGIEIVEVAALPVNTLSDRMNKAMNDKTAAVLMSAVFFNTGQIAEDLKTIASKCEKLGLPFLIDAYHALNVIPFEITGLESAYIVGGGYKYCQLGEGNCFLRFPKDSKLRPVITGWMADFESLEKMSDGKIKYSDGGARFAGSTYDPVSHYRAAEVFDFFEREKLTPKKLREISQAQMKILCEEFDKLNAPKDLIERDHSISLNQIAGFLALKTKKASELSEALKRENIFTDYRGSILRFGPAPYLSDEQIRSAIQTLSKFTSIY